jgi:hypothetical protein
LSDTNSSGSLPAARDDGFRCAPPILHATRSILIRQVGKAKKSRHGTGNPLYTFRQFCERRNAPCSTEESRRIVISICPGFRRNCSFPRQNGNCGSGCPMSRMAPTGRAGRPNPASIWGWSAASARSAASSSPARTTASTRWPRPASMKTAKKGVRRPGDPDQRIKDTSSQSAGSDVAAYSASATGADAEGFLASETMRPAKPA